MLGNVALIVAAGIGSRFQEHKLPKQYQYLAGKPMLVHTIERFMAEANIDMIIVVINEDHVDLYQQATRHILTDKRLEYVIGGQTRQESVRLGLEKIKALGVCENVLIHDAARPLLSSSIIQKVIASLAKYKAVDVRVPVADTLKYDNKVVDRSNYSLTQTPQGFAFKVIYELHQRWKEESYTDDISLCLAAGVEVGVAVGEQINFKVTFPEDLAYAEKIMNHKYKKMSIRVGSGFDVHRYKPAVAAKIPICGVLVESEWAVEAHSDGDVGLHAITDALLGAVACGDIGEHFPPSDPKWQGVDSAVFLKHAHELVIQRGGSINNVDVTIICERPKVSAYKQQMAERVADILKIKPNQVGIKATTTEKMGALGRMEGIAAQAICSINIINPEEN